MEIQERARVATTSRKIHLVGGDAQKEQDELSRLWQKEFGVEEEKAYPGLEWEP